MKRIETQPTMNQLLHDLPETTQEVIRGGTSNDSDIIDPSVDSEAMALKRLKPLGKQLVHPEDSVLQHFQVINMNQLLYDLPETAQEVIRGGTFNEANEADSTESIATPTIGVGGYIRIKKLNSGGQLAE